MSKEGLMLKVRQHLVEHPGDAADILLAVSDGLKEFERVQRTARSREGLVAMQMYQFSQPLSASADPVGLVYVAFQLYPEGTGGDPSPYAPAERKWWATFLACCQKQKNRETMNSYISGVAERHMPGISKWWAEVVRPEIDQMTQEKS